MNRTEAENEMIYEVVINAEEQYSIWPAGRPIPLGWRSAGRTGTKAECLEYIDKEWTDMRPSSARQAATRLVGSPED